MPSLVSKSAQNFHKTCYHFCYSLLCHLCRVAFQGYFLLKIVNFITCTWKLEVYVKIYFMPSIHRKDGKEWENVVLNLKSHERKSINISRENHECNILRWNYANELFIDFPFSSLCSVLLLLYTQIRENDDDDI